MAKDKGIPLSPKHGVNPSLVLCFWCGKEMGVALVGRIRKSGDNDAEAPRASCFGLEPCDECKANMAKGVHVVEVTEDGSKFDGNRRFALTTRGGEAMWPTGRWVVVSPASMKQSYKAGDRVLCDKEVMDMLLGVAEKPAKSGEESAK